MAVSARREARIDISANADKMDSGIAGARRKLRGLGKDAEKGFGGGRVVGGALKQVGARGADSAINFVKDTIGGVFDVEKALTRLQITGDLSAKQMGVFRDALAEVSEGTGIAKRTVIEGAATYIDLTGDVAGATTAMAAFARIAQASGAATADVATASSALQMSMKLDPSQVETAFSGLIVQGKAGAVSVRDFAGELATLAPQFAQFKGGTGLDGIREMGAAFQVIRIGAGSASIAATQFEALMAEIGKSGKELGAIGISVFEKDGKSLRGASDIFEQIAKNKQLASVETMEKIFGRKESQAAVRSIREHIDKFRELKVVGQDAGAVQRDLATYLDSSSGRLESAWNRVKNSIADAFTPERIDSFANAIEGLSEKVEPLATMLGGIVDAFNGLVDVGKSIRGKLGGDEEAYRWGIGGNEIGQRLMNIGDESDPERKAKLQKSLQMDFESKAADDAATQNILGGEVNERTSPESIRRAVMAHYSTREDVPGKLGEQFAGDSYLRNAGVDSTKRDQLYAKYQSDAMTKLSNDLVAAVKAGLSGLQTNVKVGSEPIVKAHNNSSTHVRQSGGRR